MKMLTHFRDCLKLTPAFSGVYIGGFRTISSSEVATALRPFYFVVHPDLFGRHPQQRSVNEESLKHLNAHLEAMQQKRVIHTLPKTLPFYIRENDAENRDTFKLVKITLEHGKDPKILLKRILESCNLPTEFVDSIKSTPQSPSKHSIPRYGDVNDFREETQFNDIDFGMDFMEFQKNFRAKKANEENSLRSWLKNNVGVAHERKKELDDLKEEVYKLQESLAKRLELKEVRYDCGWNFEHYRGCLKTLERLADLHEHEMQALKGRIVVFAAFTGVSLEGHVMLFTGDVLNNWLDFIKNIPKHDVFLKIIPAYEIALSQVLRNIKIGRRKFMPKAQAYHYAGHLRKVTTSLLDFLSKQKYPKSWPESLNDYEIVVESEAGPLMVSPTGQFIAPAMCPGSILVEFITHHLDEAKSKAEHYNTIKHVERELHQRCVDTLKLKSLQKDDSVTPERMVKSLEKLLTEKVCNLTNLHLNITNFYSVMSDGTVCIPWDWKN